MSKTEGSILPLALIMTLTLLLAAVALGTVIVDGVKRARDTDASVGAYALADTGVERQLFEVRKNGTKISDVQLLGGTLPDGSSWISTGSLEPATTKTIARLETDSFAVLDLFDPDDISSPPKIASVSITWDPEPGCPTAAVVEASYTSWDLSVPVPQWPTTNQYTVENKNGGGSITINLDEDRAYRLRLRAFECAATNLRVTTRDPLGSVKAYPGDITLSAEGTYKNATQKIAVTMPRLDVLSGIFSYVVFSECLLYKGDAAAPACP